MAENGMHLSWPTICTQSLVLGLFGVEGLAAVDVGPRESTVVVATMMVNCLSMRASAPDPRLPSKAYNEVNGCFARVYGRLGRAVMSRDCRPPNTKWEAR